jgi:hypothetical protein
LQLAQSAHRGHQKLQHLGFWPVPVRLLLQRDGLVEALQADLLGKLAPGYQKGVLGFEVLPVFAAHDHSPCALRIGHEHIGNRIQLVLFRKSYLLWPFFTIPLLIAQNLR